MRIYDAHSADQIAEPIPQGKGVSSLVISPVGDRFAICGLDGRIELHDMETGRSLTGKLWHGDRRTADTRFEIKSLAFTRDGTQLLTAGPDATARLWDLGPRRTDAIPSWLPELAESVGGLQIRLRPGGEATPQLTAVSYTKSVEVLGRLRGLPGTNAWERLAGWFLAAPEMRAASPMLQGSAKP